MGSSEKQHMAYLLTAYFVSLIIIFFYFFLLFGWGVLLCLLVCVTTAWPGYMKGALSDLILHSLTTPTSHLELSPVPCHRILVTASNKPKKVAASFWNFARRMMGVGSGTVGVWKKFGIGHCPVYQIPESWCVHIPKSCWSFIVVFFDYKSKPSICANF